jgi:hypothetical protein
VLVEKETLVSVTEELPAKLKRIAVVFPDKLVPV